jgi:hypothetical protein
MQNHIDIYDNGDPPGGSDFRSELLRRQKHPLKASAEYQRALDEASKAVLLSNQSKPQRLVLTLPEISPRFVAVLITVVFAVGFSLWVGYSIVNALSAILMNQSS